MYNLRKIISEDFMKHDLNYNNDDGVEENEP